MSNVGTISLKPFIRGDTRYATEVDGGSTEVDAVQKWTESETVPCQFASDPLLVQSRPAGRRTRCRWIKTWIKVVAHSVRPACGHRGAAVDDTQVVWVDSSWRPAARRCARAKLAASMTCRMCTASARRRKGREGTSEQQECARVAVMIERARLRGR